MINSNIFVPSMFSSPKVVFSLLVFQPKSRSYATCSVRPVLLYLITLVYLGETLKISVS